MKQFYTYLHCKPDGDPFYVGKGSGRRCYKFYQRGQHHKNIVAKHGIANILVYIFPCDSEDQALADEIQHIAQLRKEGYELCNYTNGGDGASGCICTEETKRKLSIIAKKQFSNPEYRKHLSEINKGKTLSVEHKEKISLANKGKSWGRVYLPLAFDVREKISLALKGRPAHNKGLFISDETKEKISAASKGNKNCLGKKASIETKLKMSESHKKRYSERK